MTERFLHAFILKLLYMAIPCNLYCTTHSHASCQPGRRLEDHYCTPQEQSGELESCQISRTGLMHGAQQPRMGTRKAPYLPHQISRRAQSQSSYPHRPQAGGVSAHPSYCRDVSLSLIILLHTVSISLFDVNAAGTAETLPPT